MDQIVSTADAVRRRPGMYVGDVDTGAGVLHMVLELVANVLDQHAAGRCSAVDLHVAPDGTVTVIDDGPGLPVDGSGGLPAIDELLTRHSNRPTVDGHRPHVHLGIGGAGLFVINALSERFELISIRDGVEAHTVHARGLVAEPLTTAHTARPSGTMIRFRPDPLIFRYPRVSRAALAQRLEDLSFLVPRLTIRYTIAGDDVTSGGLPARVALVGACDLADVAIHRGSFTTARGPIEVEVALAWRDPRWHAHDSPVFHSFVNLGRTSRHGSHVDGLVDGISLFLFGDTASLAAPPVTVTGGLVAAVAIVLADVLYGEPTKDRLDTPEARAPVAEATQLALHRWAEAHPAAAAALRARQKPR